MYKRSWLCAREPLRNTWRTLLPSLRLAFLGGGVGAGVLAVLWAWLALEGTVRLFSVVSLFSEFPKGWLERFLSEALWRGDGKGWVAWADAREGVIATKRVAGTWGRRAGGLLEGNEWEVVGVVEEDCWGRGHVGRRWSAFCNANRRAILPSLFHLGDQLLSQPPCFQT